MAFHIVVLVHWIEDGAIHARGKFDCAENRVILPAHEFNHPEAIPIRDDELVGLG